MARSVLARLQPRTTRLRRALAGTLLVSMTIVNLGLELGQFAVPEHTLAQSGVPECRDGIDNDHDGLVDYASGSCSNLIVNGSFESGSTGFNSEYANLGTQTGGSCRFGGIDKPDAGEILVSDNPATCHKWYGSETSRGKMLLVNAAPTQRNFWCQTVNVSRNTSYTLDVSMRAAVVIDSQPSRVRWTVNGQNISGDVQTPTSFKDYHFTWNSGNNTTAQVCGRNVDTSAETLDIVVDDIAFTQTGGSCGGGDPDCSSPDDPTEGNGGGQCKDGIDNDNDGKTDAYVEKPISGGGFQSERATPKYSKRWIASITCKTGNSAPVTIGNGRYDMWERVRTAIDQRGLDIDYPAPPSGPHTYGILQSEGGTGAGRTWYDNATPHLPTLNAVCKILGYETYVSSTCQDIPGENSDDCNFFSPEDDYLLRFSGNLTLPACQDGIDNDGDGKKDYPADDGCATPNDDSEKPHDEDCSDPNDPNEGSPQCSDGKDNDGDGAVDYPADFSCSGPNDNDEEHPKAACQDGIDNDGDGLVDYPQDPGCESKQDNDERNPNGPQCDNGKDDDNDGKVDYPADPGCTDPRDDKEQDEQANLVLTKTVSQTVSKTGGATYTFRVRNTGTADAHNVRVVDWFVDANGNRITTPVVFQGSVNAYCDYSSTRRQYDCSIPDPIGPNREATFTVTFAINNSNLCNTTLRNQAQVWDQSNVEYGQSTASAQTTVQCQTQCNDGIDNDGDGAVDLQDFSCQGDPNNNDETNPKAQCQDGIDNDGDGLIDYGQDPACDSKQDNDESPKNVGNLTINKTGPSTIAPNDTITYNIQVRNIGNYNATNVKVVDPFVNSLTFVPSSSSNGCQLNAGQVVCDLGTMTPQQTRDLSLAFTVKNTVSCGANIQNSATVSATNTSSTTSTQASTAVVCAQPNITVNKTARVQQARYGDNIVYDIVVRNTGNGTATNVVVLDEASYPFSLVSAQNATCQYMGAGFYPPNGRVSCSPFTLAPNESKTITLTLRNNWQPQNCSSGLQLVNEVVATWQGPGGGTSTNQTYGSSSIQLACQTQCNDGVDNDGDGAIDLQDFSCQGDPNNDDETYPKAQCQDGLDNDGDHLTDYPEDPACQSKQDNDESPKNLASLSLTATGPETAKRGDTIQYVVRVTNTSNDIAREVEIMRTGDNGLEFVSASSNANCKVAPAQGCVVPELAPGQSYSITYTYRVPSSAQCGLQYIKGFVADALYVDEAHSNYVTTKVICAQCSDGIDNDGDGAIDHPNDFSCSGPDDDDETYPKAQCQDGIDNDNDGLIDYGQDPGCTSPQDNDESNVISTDLSIIKTAPTTAVRGGTIAYRIDVRNNGTQTANNVVITDPIPQGLNASHFIANQSQGCSLTNNFSAIVCRNFNLTPGQSRSFTITFTLPTVSQCTTTVLSNTATVAADSSDPQAANNSDTATTTLTCPQPTVGCIEILKIANNEFGQPIQNVPAFTFRLDGGTRTVQNAANGTARLDNVPVGNHTITEEQLSGWTQLFVSPSGGNVTVTGGNSCSQVTFLNQKSHVPECRDGIDNDGDGAIDHPNDFSCSGPDDDDETFPKAQCQDGIDNDNDGLIDYGQDPGCTSPQDNDETDGLSNADVSILKKAPPSIVRGQAIIYQVSVTNIGPGTARNVVITDPIPQGLTAANFVASQSAGCVLNSTQTAVVCNNFDLAPAGFKSFNIVFNVPQTGSCTQTTLQNTATVATSSFDPVSSNNTSETKSTTVTCPAATFTISKTDDRSTAAPGELLHYRITVQNTSSTVANNVTVEDLLPSGVEVISFDNGGSVNQNPQVLLHSATLSGQELLIRYSNATSTCQRVYPEGSASYVGSNTACTSGTFQQSVQTVSGLSAGQQIRLCSSNNLTSCSQYVTINGSTGNGQKVVWQNLTFGAFETKTFVVDARVNQYAPDGFILTNRAFVGAVSAHDTTTVREQATDIAITKTAPQTSNKADILTYNIRVVNTGTSVARNVVVRDTVPAGLNFYQLLGSSSCALQGNSVVCDAFDLQPGEGRDLTLAFSVKSTVQCNTQISNTATVQMSTPTNNTSNDSSTVSTTIVCPQPQSNLSLDKSSVFSVQRGGTLLYTLTIFNQGPEVAPSAQIRDLVPAGLTFLPAQSSQSCTLQGGEVVCELQNITTSAPKTVSLAFTVTNAVTCGSTIQNSARITSSTATDPNMQDNEDAAATTVTCPAPTFGITKSDGKNVVQPGESLVYTINVTNTSQTPATGVTVTDILPPAIEFASADKGGTHSNGVVTWSNLSIGAGETVTLKVFTTVKSNTPSGTILRNNAYVQGAQATDTTEVRAGDADLSLKKEAPPTVERGQTVSYTLEARNQSTSVTATNVVVSDVIPQGLSAADFVAAQSQGCVLNAGLTSVLCDNFDLAPGASKSFTITFRVPQVASCTQTTLVNTASVSASNADPVSSNNTDTVSTTVTCPQPTVGCIDVTKIAQDAQGNPVQNIPSFTFRLDGGNQTVQSNANGTARFQNVPVGQHTVTEDAVSGWNQLFVFPTGGAVTVNGGNSCAQVSFLNRQEPVVTDADLSLKKEAPATVERGQTVSYTLEARNQSTSVTATNVVVSDVIPQGLSAADFVAAQSQGCVLNAGLTSVLCENFDLAPGASKSFTITFRVPQVASCTQTTLVNTASVSASNADPVSSNNTDTVSTTVTCPQPQDTTLSITKVGTGSAARGQPLIYTVTVTNTGPTAASNVRVIDNVPHNLTYVETGSTPGCVLTTVQNVQQVTCQSITSLAPAASKTYTFKFMVKQDAVCNDTIRNQADAQADNAPLVWDDAFSSVRCFQCSDGIDNDGDGAIDYPNDFSCSSPTDDDETNPKAACQDGIDNDHDGLIDYPQDPGCESKQDNDESNATSADLSIIKSGSLSATRGSSVLYTISVTNHGPDAASNVLIRDVNPAGLALDASNSDTICTQSGSAVVCSIPTIQSSDTKTVNIAFAAPTVAQCTEIQLVNIASVTSTTTDPNFSNNISDAVQTTLKCQKPDLSILKSGPADATRGGSVTYVIGVTNSGSVAATNVTISDPVPAGLTFQNASETSCSEQNGTVTCAIGTLGASASKSFTLTFAAPTVAQCTETTIQNVATVTADQTDADTSDNTSGSVSTILRCPVAQYGCIDVIKQTIDANGAPVTPIPAFSFRLNGTGSTVQNDASGRARFESVTPGSHVVSEIAQNGWTQVSAYPQNGQVTVAPGNSCASVVFINRQQQTGTGDLTITKTGPAAVTKGDQIVYTVTVRNIGTQTVTGVVANDPIPTGLSFVGSNGASCTQNTANNIACTLGDMNGGATRTFTLTFSTGAAGGACTQTVVQNIASVTATGGETNTSNNTSNPVSTTINCPSGPQVDLAIQKTGSSSILRGSTMVYRLNVQNLGTATGANVTVTDAIPTGLQFLSASGASLGCSVQGGNVVCSLGSMGPGAVRPFTLSFLVPTQQSCTQTVVQNVATVTSAQADLNTANNTSGTVTTTVQCPATQLGCIDVVALAFDANGNPLYNVPSFTYTLDSSRTVSTDATGKAKFTDVTAGAHTVIQNAASNWQLLSVSPPNGTVNVQSGSSCSTVVFSNRQTSTVSQTSFSIDVSVDDSTVEQGDNITYTIRVRNLSGSTVQNVTVYDDLSDEVNFDDCSGNCERNGRFLSWKNLTFAPNEEKTFYVDVEVDDRADGTLYNTARVYDKSDSVSIRVEDSSNADDKEIELSKVASTGEVFPGGIVEYTLRIENTGKTDLQDLTVTDHLPAGVTIIDDGDADKRSGGKLVWEIDELNEDDDWEVRYRVSISTGAYPGDILRNEVTVTDDDDDIDETESVTVFVIGNLPQTGASIRSGNASDARLTPINARSAEGSASVPVAVWLSIVSLITGAGATIGRRIFIGF